MAIRENLCTVLDVRNLSEFITTTVRDNARILQFIQREDPGILSALLQAYPAGATALLASGGPWNGPVQLPFPYVNESSGSLVQNTGTATLADITASSTAMTELWTLVFSSVTAYSVHGSYSGVQSAGSTDTDYSNDLISIAAADWNGIPVVNDVFFVATYRFDPLVVSLSAKMATSLAISSVYEGLSEAMALEGRRMRKESMEILHRMQRPNSEDGLRLGTFSPRSVSPEGTAYKINAFGADVSQYADNERTLHDDSALGSA